MIINDWDLCVHEINKNPQLTELTPSILAWVMTQYVAPCHMQHLCEYQTELFDEFINYMEKQL